MIYESQLKKPVRLALIAALGLVAIISLPKKGKATGAIGTEDLSGPWQISLQGNTGCGSAAMLFTGVLSTAGSGSGTLVGHSTGCGDSSTTQTFTVTSMNANGSGKATLTCGSGCGWDFTIQVSPDRSIFNLVDVDPANPNNTPAGVAIHR